MINVMEIPEVTYKMGLEKGSDTFCFLGRISQPEDQDAYEQYQDAYEFEELKSDITVPEGLTAYFNDANSLGDNRDTTYLMTPDFTFNSDEDFVVVYGVNHTLTGKAHAVLQCSALCPSNVKRRQQCV